MCLINSRLRENESRIGATRSRRAKVGPPEPRVFLPRFFLRLLVLAPWALGGSLTLLFGCAPSPTTGLALRQVVLYQNGVGYFEHTGRVEGETLQLRFKQHELNDALKTLAIVDMDSRQRLQATSVSFPPPAQAQEAAEETVPVMINLGQPKIRPKTRHLRISYAVSAPAWRASYRLLLGHRGKAAAESTPALLQAWAVVDNVSGKSWQGTAIALETAAPLTFATDLRTPQFVSRPDATGTLLRAPAQGVVVGERAIPGDRDQDRLLDAQDMCPDEPETYNGYEDDDGCPDKGRVQVHWGRLEILDKIFFAPNSAEPPENNLPILDAVAATLKGNPQIQQVAIQGHAAGAEAHPWALSAQRAARVRSYLHDQGVTTQLKLQPMGNTRPVDQGASEDAQSKNRRVEFSILELDQSGQTVQRMPGQAMAQGKPDPSRLAALPAFGQGAPRYQLPKTLTVKKGTSVMISLLNQPVAGDEVLLYRPDPAVEGSAHHPFRAARLKNDTGRTLVPGPVALYAKDRFIGEALLGRLSDQETAFLPYALDRSLAIQTATRNEIRPGRLLRLWQGVCTVEDQELRITRYQIRPGQRQGKTLVLRQPRQADYTLVDPPPGTETTADGHLIPLPLISDKDTVLEIQEQRPTRRTVQLLEGTEPFRVGLYLDQSDLDPKTEARLRAVMALRQEVSRRARQLERQRDRLGDLGSQITQVRRSLLALAQTDTQPALRRQLTAQLKTLLKQAESVGRTLSTASAAQVTAEAEAREALRQLTFGPARDVASP